MTDCWILRLNDMRSPKIEILSSAARANTREELLVFIERERVATYRDGRWSKSFRQGGPLEWFNLPFGDESFVRVSAQDEIERLRQYVSAIPEVSP